MTEPASNQSAQDLGVSDLLQAVELLKQAGQASAAAALYGTWIEHHAEHPLLYAVLFNYSVALSDAGQLEGARRCLERALTLNPEFIPAYINLGRVQERQGDVVGALTQWSAALARMTAVTGTAIVHKTTALNQSARALEAADQDAPAEQMLRQSLELDPTQREAIQHLIALRQRQCEWPVVLPSERVDHQALMRGLSPLSAAALIDDPLYQLALAWHYNRSDVGDPPPAPPRAPVTASPGPLRVGYLSSDLREHAVGYLLTEVFELHQRARVEVFAYYCGVPSQDPLHRHFRATADHFIDLTDVSDDAAADRVRADGVQILVDLNGYTRDARLKLVARRPAPVIVNWLGFPGTMASPYHHYLIADDFIVPATHERYYSERVLRLPCYQPSFRRRAVAEQAPTRAAAGLPEGGMVYCCFNGTHKLRRVTFDLFLAVLSRVPGSVLWLLGSNPATEERLRSHAAGRGVARERVIFASKLANPAHLARYRLADLFLDTSPYGAHTTASDALFMGVPVLTYAGRSFASRVCGSLVTSAGVPELVCASESDFVERAVHLGTHRADLEPLARRLRDGRETCTLFDTPLLVRELESLYEHMWEENVAGRLPRPPLHGLEAYLEVGAELEPERDVPSSDQSYEDFWLARLAQRHRHRPLEPDGRLVTESVLARWER